jgi:ubiquinone/menaquinone biosynthesis C-methylase UbiE
MGVYGEQVLPRVTNILLGNKEFGKIRARACEGLRGDVVEIGFGSGLNVPFLPSEVTGLWVIEPSGVAWKLAGKRVDQTSVPVHRSGLDGQRLDLPDERFDCALSTMTLCTIPDAVAAMKEVHRVLKPGGAFHFAEHGGSPDEKVARTQSRLNGMQNRFAGGCNLNRDIPAIIKDGGFEIEALDNFYLKGPKAMGYMFVGRAKKV